MTKEVLRCMCMGVETEAWHRLLYTSQIWGFHRVIIVHLLTIKCCDEPLPSSDVTAGSRTPVITAPLSRRCRRGRRSGDEEEIAQTQQNRSVNTREIRVCRWHSWQHWLGDKCLYDAGMWISRQLVSLSSLSIARNCYIVVVYCEHPVLPDPPIRKILINLRRKKCSNAEI